jgi:hypothetical protein
MKSSMTIPIKALWLIFAVLCAALPASAQEGDGLWPVQIVLVQKSGDEATASSCVAKALPLNVKMLTATEVIIDPVSINGVRPPEESWKTCIRRLQGYVTGKVRVNPFQELTIPLDEEGFMTENPKFKTEDMGLNHLAMVFAPAFRRVNRGLFQRFENDRQMILFDRQGIEASVNSFLSKEKIWEIVIFHEIGHAIGVPSQSSPSHKSSHCSNPSCVMYPRIDTRSALSVIFKGYPVDLCKDCQAEVEAAKREYNNKARIP